MSTWDDRITTDKDFGPAFFGSHAGDFGYGKDTPPQERMNRLTDEKKDLRLDGGPEMGATTGKKDSGVTSGQGEQESQSPRSGYQSENAGNAVNTMAFDEDTARDRRVQVWEDNTLTTGEKMVLLVIIDHLDEKNEWFATYQTIADYSSLSRNYAGETVRELESKGWIERTDRASKGYTFAWAKNDES